MSSPTITITTITANDAQQALQSDGLDTLGLTTLALSTRWADTTPDFGSDYSTTDLTLNIGSPHAPYRGILEFAFSPVTTTLAADLGTSDTTLTVNSGDGANFPSPSGGTMLLTLISKSSTNMEVHPGGVDIGHRRRGDHRGGQGAGRSAPSHLSAGLRDDPRDHPGAVLSERRRRSGDRAGGQPNANPAAESIRAGRRTTEAA
jgi:hypothetical protein